jgi:hypothetical protein
MLDNRRRILELEMSRAGIVVQSCFGFDDEFAGGGRDRNFPESTESESDLRRIRLYKVKAYATCEEDFPSRWQREE